MDIPRILDLPKLLAANSYFLFGPRQTGKTFMIRQQFPTAKYYNLHESDTFLKFNQAPHRLRQELTGKDTLVIMDEIQKLPLLLDEIQVMIDDRQMRFLLTGSSARSLKRKGLNLLGGRARTKRFYPNGHPQVAPVATQQADNLAKNLKKMIVGKSDLAPFQYHDQGSMATVGRNKALVDMPKPKLHLGGFAAWCIWMGLHLMLILGVKNRLFIFLNWMYNYFTYDQSLRLIFKKFADK